MNEFQSTQNAQQIVETAWRDQAIWSEVANQLKAKLTIWRYFAALAGVLGAFLETLAATLAGLSESWWWVRALIALIGTIILAIVPYIMRTRMSTDQVREWVRARSASEALKEVIYRYLVGAPPFESLASPADLIKKCNEVKKKVRDLSIYAASIEPPQKLRPLTLTMDGYLESRVSDQIERYYRPKGREKALTAKRLHGLEFWLGMLAVVISAMASAATATGITQLSALGPWVAVVTTASAAVTAHLAASRYDHEAMIYFGTADRLISLRDEWLVNPERLDTECIHRFVNECEHAISTENEAWLAEWTPEKAK
jgi:hypothetical protein